MSVVVHCLKRSQEPYLNTFLLLKLINTSGKSKVSNAEVSLIAILLSCNEITVKRRIEWLVKNRWIRRNQKTSYFTLKSFKNISFPKENEYFRDCEFNLEELRNFKAQLGAIVFSFLYLRFAKTLRKNKVVAIKGATYQSLYVDFIVNAEFAPIAISGASSFYGLNTSKVQRLKHAAAKAGLIQVKKKFTRLDLSQHEIAHFNENTNNAAFFAKNKIFLQEIDHVRPKIDLSRFRKSYK